MNKQIRNKMHKGQGALTAASEKKVNNELTKTMKTVSEVLRTELLLIRDVQ